MIFELPLPPSSNALFADVVVKGRVRRIVTRAYKAWRVDATERLMQQYNAYGSPAIHKPVALSIRLGMNYRGDIGNREKAVTDLLVAHLDMPDDRWIERIVIERDQSISGALVTIEGSWTNGDVD